jgi:CxxC-x17-CxxC domain-containing protein
MGNFNRDRRSDGGRSFPGKRDFDNRGTDRITLHKTICSKCGKSCEVPFRPTGSKPVFCRDCFRENGGSDSRRPERRDFPRPNFDNRNANNSSTTESPQYKEQFEALNSKLDKILKILTPVVSTKKAPLTPEE